MRSGGVIMHHNARCHCDVRKIVPCQPRAQARIAFRSMGTVRPSLRYEPEVATISRRSAAASCTDVQDAPRKDGERVMITQRWHGASSFEQPGGRLACKSHGRMAAGMPAAWPRQRRQQQATGRAADESRVRASEGRVSAFVESPHQGFWGHFCLKRAFWAKNFFACGAPKRASPMGPCRTDQDRDPPLGQAPPSPPSRPSPSRGGSPPSQAKATSRLFTRFTRF